MIHELETISLNRSPVQYKFVGSYNVNDENKFSVLCIEATEIFITEVCSGLYTENPHTFL